MTLADRSITILTPVYNGADFVAETIESVLEQKYPDLEYIVLDDGSIDKTLNVLEQFSDRVRVISHPNMGETRTVNKGLALARGTFVAVVNADDPLRPRALELMALALDAQPEAVLAYPDWVEIDRDSNTLNEYRLPDYNIRNMLRGFTVAMGPGVLIRRASLAIAGFRDESLRYTGDLDLWFRLALLGPFVHVPEFLATHRVHPQSTSVFDKGGLMAAEVARVAHKCLDNSSLPNDLKLQRRAILSKAHFIASMYCGRNFAARAWHLVESFSLSPLVFLWLLPARMAYLCLGWVPKPVRRYLKRVLALDPRGI